ncbi:MAG TPA: NAD(P)H-dependent oxidoreductase [Puia sp.]|nr:NAD(P)H-dependent oxidoreductase [Puia sp.]
MKRVFLNASQNKKGNTATLAHQAFGKLSYSTINLVDYHIDQLGQKSRSDQFSSVIEQLFDADILIIGTPVYWRDMTGYLKTFIDRLAELETSSAGLDAARLKGIDVYLIIQGSNPKDAIPGIVNVISHVCRYFRMRYKGLLRNTKEAKSAQKHLV